MDGSTIGIKIADGTYYPILDEESRKRKKLVLTTVNDNQESMQIDLYRSRGSDIAEAVYIGSLLIEDIKPAARKDPEIELRVGVDEDGNLNAEAGDVASGDRQSLSVSLESVGERDFDTPDFELDESVFDEVPDFDEEDKVFGQEDDSFDDESLSEDAEAFSDDEFSLPGDEPVLEEAVFDDETGEEDDLSAGDGLDDLSGFGDESEDFSMDMEEDDSAGLEMGDLDGFEEDESLLTGSDDSDFGETDGFDDISLDDDSSDDAVFGDVPDFGGEEAFGNEDDFGDEAGFR